MIPVSLVPEPSDFTVKVRHPGNAFLAFDPFPTNNRWNHHDYWRRALGDLHVAYNGICAYCSSYTVQRNWSVDHFVPKSKFPAGAYEWDNFRLSRARLNHNKGNHQDMLDPFILTAGWFQFDFRSFLLKPNPLLAVSDQQKVRDTIDRLKLNRDNDYVNERTEVIRQCCVSAIPFQHIERNYPFLAVEMIRQNFDTAFLKERTAYFQANP